MFTSNCKIESTKWAQPRAIGALLVSMLTLTGCYVDVSHQHEDNYDYNDKEVTPYNVTDYATQFLVDAALIPFSLAAESPYMVIDPDAYTTPRARSLSRALITNTTYTYLFDDADCTFGGYTQTEAVADTTSYNDGYTVVEFTMNAQAYNCEVKNRGQFHLVNSDVDYDIVGWYDDWEDKISSIDAALTGNVSIEYNGNFISHSNIDINTQALTSRDFVMDGTSTLLLDDGYYIKQVQLTTRSDVHFNLGAGHPHAGSIRLKHATYWVDLKFEANGLWRTSSNGQERYRTWQELGF